MKKYLAICLMVCAALAGSGLAFAQTYTVNFTADPPAADGVVSPGEWDAAEAPITEFTDHGGSAESDPAEPTSVRLLYSVDALYILYECTDTDVVSIVTGSERLASAAEGTPGRQTAADMGWTFGGTDYIAVYLDPANVADDREDLNPDLYSYSIQAEPSITANNENDDLGNSYNYSEHGRYGSFRVRNPNPVEVDGVTQYWLTGLSWEIYNTTITDGPTDDGFVMEFRIPWEDLNYPYYQHVGSEIIDGLIILDAEDATVRNQETSVWGLASVDGGAVSGMPAPGTVWKAQICRHSASADPAYVNWVGDTSGFVSRPFGDLLFGEATGTDVSNAMLHD